MASTRPQPPKPLDLDLTIISARHLKNVNWKNGDIKPYAVFWIDPDHRLATKSDDSGSTRPVWNERFTLPLALPLPDSYLTIEIFHSKPTETPKPLVGTIRIYLKDLPELDDPTRVRSFELNRPSGRPQGKIRIKLAVRERHVPPPYPQDYHNIHAQSYYYNSATMPPPPPPPREYMYGTVPPPPPSFSPPSFGSYSPSPYYSGYYSSAPPPPMPPRPFYERAGGGYSGPSAPVDYSMYDQKQRGGKMGFGTGLGVGVVAGALGGLALEEGIKYEEDKVSERVENEVNSVRDSREDYRDYRVDY